jgi:hypothetical protein
MLKHIVLSGDSALHLINVLAQVSQEDIRYVFSGVIRLWLDALSIQFQKPSSSGSSFSNRFDPGISGELPPIDIDPSFYDRQKMDLFKKMAGLDSALYGIIKFTTKAAEQNTSIRLGMLEAGSLALVLAAFSNTDFKLSSLVGIPGTEGKRKDAKSAGRKVSDAASPPLLSSSTINAEASTLSILIHTAKFVQRWGSQEFNTRLFLCSSLVDSLLGNEGVLDDEYCVTRALFQNIVAANT